MKKNTAKIIILSALFIPLLLSVFFRPVSEYFIEYKNQLQVEKQQRLASEHTGKGLDSLKNEHWEEAKGDFSAALAFNAESDDAEVGLAEAIYHLKGTEAALVSLDDCTSSRCNKKRTSLHTKAWDTQKKQGIKVDTIEETWRHLEAMYGTFCAAETLTNKSLMTPSERSTAFPKLIKMLEILEEKRSNESLGKAGDASAISHTERVFVEWSRDIGMMNSMGGAVAVRKRGRAIGANLISKSKGEASNCTDINAIWNNDEEIREELLHNHPPDLNDLFSQGRNSIPAGMGRSHALKEYRQKLFDLFQVSASIGLLEGRINQDKIDKQTVTHKWKSKPFDSVNGITYANGMLFFGSDDSKVYALDAQTGIQQWSFPTEGIVIGSPLAVKSMVFFGTMDNVFYAVDMETGQLQWEKRLPLINGQVSTSPIVYNETVLFGPWDGCLYAVERKTGKECWTFSGLGSIDHTPIIEKNTVYFITTLLDPQKESSNIYAVDCKSGKLIWEKSLQNKITSSPIVENGVIYFPNSNLGLEDRVENYISALNGVDGKKKWSIKIPDAVRSISVDKNSIYFKYSDQYICSINRKNGKNQWKFEPEGYYNFSSPFLFKDSLYFISDDEVLYKINASNGKFSEKFHFDIENIQLVCILDHTFYFQGKDNALYAVDTQNL